MISARILTSLGEAKESKSSVVESIKFQPSAEPVCKLISPDAETVISLVDYTPPEAEASKRYIVFLKQGIAKCIEVPATHSVLSMVRDGKHVMSYSHGVSTVEPDNIICLFNLKRAKKIKDLTHDLPHGLGRVRLNRILGLIGSSNIIIFPQDNTSQIQLRNAKMELLNHFSYIDNSLLTAIALPNQEFLCATNKGWIRFSAANNAVSLMQVMPDVNLAAIPNKLVSPHIAVTSLHNSDLLITGHRLSNWDTMQIAYWTLKPSSIEFLGCTPVSASRIECILDIPGTPYFVTVQAAFDEEHKRDRHIKLWLSSGGETPRCVETKNIKEMDISAEYPPAITAEGTIVSVKNEMIHFPQIIDYLNSATQILKSTTIFPQNSFDSILESYCHFYPRKSRAMQEVLPELKLDDSQRQALKKD